MGRTLAVRQLVRKQILHGFHSVARALLAFRLAASVQHKKLQTLRVLSSRRHITLIAVARHTYHDLVFSATDVKVLQSIYIVHRYLHNQCYDASEKSSLASARLI